MSGMEPVRSRHSPVSRVRGSAGKIPRSVATKSVRPSGEYVAQIGVVDGGGAFAVAIFVFEHEVCGAGGVEVEGRYGVFPGAVEYVSAQCVYVVESGGIGRCGVSLEAFYGFGTAEDLNAGLVGGSGGRLRGTMTAPGIASAVIMIG